MHDGLEEQGELRDKLGYGGQQWVRDGLSGSGLLLQHDVHHELEDVWEVGEAGTGLGQQEGLLAQIAHQQLPQDVVEVDLGGALHRAEGKEPLGRLAGATQPLIQHSLVGGAQHQGILEEHGQRVDVDVEGQHDSARQEGVRLAVVPRKEGQPHLHARLPARQPQRLQQVPLLTVGAAGRPHVLHAMCQNHRRAEWQLRAIKDQTDIKLHLLKWTMEALTSKLQS